MIVLAAGGSAIGAEAVSALAARSFSVPVDVVQDYIAPPVDGDTLVVACSHSGDTEEVLHAFAASGSATAGGVTPMRLAITSGGWLAAHSEEGRYALFRYEHPGPPKVAMGYGLFPLLAILDRLRALSLDLPAIRTACAGLTAGAAEWGLDAPESHNPAKQLARRLAGRIPVIVGAETLAVAARRWATQINELSKQWAFSARLPEIDHTLIDGLGAPAAREALHVVALDAPFLHPRNRQRIPLTTEELERAGVSHECVQAGGEDPLAAMLRAAYLGDWVAYYLAMLNGVDPQPNPTIARIKDALGRTAADR